MYDVPKLDVPLTSVCIYSDIFSHLKFN